MTKYRVDIEGSTVWSKNITDPDGESVKHFPKEYLSRPADPAEGEPYPPAHHLFIGHELVGVQISFAQELAEMAAAAGSEG